MSRTLLQLIVHTAQQTGLSVEDRAFDASGNTTTTGRVDALKRWSDNKFNGWHLYVDGGSPTLRELVVTDFGQSNGELTWQPALGAAPNSLDFLLTLWSRSDLVNAIQQAILELHDRGLLVRRFEMLGLVGGSPLYNAGFDYWTSASALDGWAATTATLARERASANVFASPTSAKLDTASGHLALGEPWKRFLDDFRGTDVRLYCAVKTTSASNARINLYTGSNNRSGFHTGDGMWQVLDTGRIAVSESATDLEPRLEIATSATAYFNAPWLESSYKAMVRDYPFPVPLATRIERVWQSELYQGPLDSGLGVGRHLGTKRALSGWHLRDHFDEAAATQVGLLSFQGDLPEDGTRLVVEASGPLNITSTDGDAVEVDYTESAMIASYAAAKLLERASVGASLSAQQEYAERISRLTRTVEQLSQGAGHNRRVALMPQVM